MVNENGMVEWWSAGGNLRHAEHSRPPLPRFNGSTPITPQLQPFHPSPPLGLGLVEYIRPLFSPVPGKSKDGKCAIARRGATSFCFLPPLEKNVGKKQHLIGAKSLEILRFRAFTPHLMKKMDCLLRRHPVNHAASCRRGS